MARALNAPLSPHEEITLRRVALGVADPSRLPERDLRRLQHLMLVVQASGRPRLTALGRQRYRALPRAIEISDTAQGDVALLLERAVRMARQQR